MYNKCNADQTALNRTTCKNVCKRLLTWDFSLVRHMKRYNEAAAVSNVTVTQHKVTYDPDASWLKFHLGINRYALYSRHDVTIPTLLKEMQSMTVISAGDRLVDGMYGKLMQFVTES